MNVFQERKPLKLAAGICLAIGVFLMIWRGPMPLEGALRELAARDAWTDGLSGSRNLTTLRRYYSLDAAFAVFTFALIFAIATFWPRLSERLRSRIYDSVFTLTLSCAMLLFLSNLTYEGPWLRLDTIMKDPSSTPIFGHRLLFLWVAKGLQSLLPGLTNLRSFYVSQWIASILALISIRVWSRYHADAAFAWAGQIVALIRLFEATIPLLVAMILSAATVRFEATSRSTYERLT